MSGMNEATVTISGIPWHLYFTLCEAAADGSTVLD